MPTLEQLQAKRAALVIALQRTDGAIAVLDELIAEATAEAREPPVPTYGGIDRATNLYWRNGRRVRDDTSNDDADIDALIESERVTPDAPFVSTANAVLDRARLLAEAPPSVIEEPATYTYLGEPESPPLAPEMLPVTYEPELDS